MTGCLLAFFCVSSLLTMASLSLTHSLSSTNDSMIPIGLVPRAPHCNAVLVWRDTCVDTGWKFRHDPPYQLPADLGRCQGQVRNLAPPHLFLLRRKVRIRNPHRTLPASHLFQKLRNQRPLQHWRRRRHCRLLVHVDIRSRHDGRHQACH